MTKRRIWVVLLSILLVIIPFIVWVHIDAVYSLVTQFYFIGSKPTRDSIIHRQFNFHFIAPGIWRSSQPRKETLKLFRKHGLKTIVNLRTTLSIHRFEKKYAEEHGLRYYHFPMRLYEKIDAAQVDEILRVLHDPENQPVLIHCREGKDRTGLIAAAYQMRFLNMPYEEAYKEMLMLGFNPKFNSQIEGILRPVAGHYGRE